MCKPLETPNTIQPTAVPLEPGEMCVTILDDGTVKIETADMAGVDHVSADEFFRMMARVIGGTVTDTKIGLAQTHTHTHEHTHQHHRH